jgi:hypothetical protein
VENYLPQLWQYLQQATPQYARSQPSPRVLGTLSPSLSPPAPSSVPALSGGGLPSNPLTGGPVASGAHPNAAGAAAGGSTLGSLLRSFLPASLGGAAAAGAGGAGALLARSQPANKGEVPMYVADPMTGRLVPNPQAAGQFPAGSYGFGGGYVPQQTNGGGQPLGAMDQAQGMPLPQPRPNFPTTSNSQMAPNQPLATGTSGPSLMQKVLDFLNNGNNSLNSATPSGGPGGWGRSPFQS